MNSPATLISEPGPTIIVLAILALIAVFFGTGIYVVSGRWAEGRPKRDAKAIERWDRARRTGFWRFTAYRSFSSSFAFCFSLAFSREWRLTHTLSLSPDEVIASAIFAVAVGLAGAWSHWYFVRHNAEEAHERAAIAQDERSA